MGVDTVTALQGETISHIAYRVYGSSRGRVEAILAHNPGLSRLPAMLPMGTVIRLPEKQEMQAPVLPALNLWD